MQSNHRYIGVCPEETTELSYEGGSGRTKNGNGPTPAFTAAREIVIRRGDEPHDRRDGMGYT